MKNKEKIIYQKIRNDLDKVPVIDAHEHSCGHYEIKSDFSVTDFFLESYIGSLLPQIDAVSAGIISDPQQPDQQKWRELVKLWPYLKYTGFGKIVSTVLQQWLLPVDLVENMYEELSERIQQRSPENGKKLFEEANIKGVITHYLAHPSCGGLDNVSSFLEGTLKFEHRFYPLLGILPLHKFYQKDDIEKIGKISDVKISSLDKLVEGIEMIISQSVDKGIVGFKDHAAYSRGLDFDAPNQQAVQEELNRILKGEQLTDADNALSDYLFEVILSRAKDYNLPVALHTGYLAGTSDTKANVKLFTYILESHPQVKFDLYHLNYPWFEDLFHIMRRFPNTVANCCWTHSFDPAGTAHFLSRALNLFPANRILGFGGDYLDIPEFTVAHLKLAKDTISIALAENVIREYYSLNSALKLAQLLLYDNPRKFYQLQNFD